MSDTPNVVSGDLEAPTIEPPELQAGRSSASATERRRLHDIWVAGTEEPDWIKAGTNEGAQELLPEGSDPDADPLRHLRRVGGDQPLVAVPGGARVGHEGRRRRVGVAVYGDGGELHGQGEEGR